MSQDGFDNKNNRGSSNMEDFPKEVVQLLMQNHPLKNPLYSAEEKMFTEELRLKDLEKKSGSGERKFDETSSFENIKTAKSTNIEKEVEEAKKVEEDIPTIVEDVVEEKEDVKERARKMAESISAKKEVKAEPVYKEVKAEPAYKEVKSEPAYKEEKVEPVHKEVEVVQFVRKSESKIKNNTATLSSNPIHKEESEMQRRTQPTQKQQQQKQQAQKRQPSSRTVERNDNYYSSNRNSMLDSVMYDDDDDYYDDEKHLDLKKIFIIVGAVAVFFALFFGFKTISLSGKLSEANATIAKLEETQTKNEDLKLEVLTLEEELKAETTPVEEEVEEEATSGDYTIHTVASGETFWVIAEKTMGNGALYTKILEANGLSENDYLSIGQELKIPNQ